MFLQRALITFTVGPLALYLIYRGGWFYFGPVAAFLILAAYEYIHLFRRLQRNPSLWIMVTAVAIQLIIAQWFASEYLAPALVIALLVMMAHALWYYERGLSQNALFDWMLMSGGVILVGWLGSHFFLLRRVEHMAWEWTMLAMLSTWLADSAAYVVGKFLAGSIIGKHKLAPRLSPNKTIEGYVGGIVLGTLVTVAIANYFSLPLFLSFTLGLFVSTVSPMGDLAISMIKREAGVKDSGVLFPGHGGALDRIDSLVWSVAIAYYLVTFFS